MKKTIFSILILIVLLLSAVTAVFADSSRTTYIAWSYSGFPNGNGYFVVTPSGLVHAWSYDHPRDGDTHWVIKPHDKFPTATTCDEGAVFENNNWKPGPLYNVVLSGYKALFLGIFPDLNQTYLLCKYPID